MRLAMLWFALLGVLAVYALQRLQGMLPLNPQGFGAVSPDSSFNTAISFRHQHQLAGLWWRIHHELSDADAGAGGAELPFRRCRHGVLVALIRGFARHTTETIGNFWVDMTRSTIYILLPLSLVLALVLVSQGVVQNLSAYQTVPTVETITYDNPKVDAAGNPVKDAAGNPVTEKATTKEQVIAMGPVASQEAIKQLGTNGGGFFNANSAHPFENPTPFSNFLAMLAIFLIPAGAVLHLRQHGGRHDARAGRSWRP